MKKVFFPLAMLCIVSFQSKAQTVADIEGNVYNTITLGSQVWMKENLKTTKFNDNTLILNIRDSVAWSLLLTGAYCDFGNNPSTSSEYGRLYNWYAVNDPRGICPAGWHVPTDSEWTVAINHLGGDSVAGAKMKEDGTSHWTFLSTRADNSSGFSALPGGDRHYTGAFATFGYYALWWSATEYDASDAWKRNMNYNNNSVGRSSAKKTYGFSVRCVRDLPSNSIRPVINFNDLQFRIRSNPVIDRITIDCFEKHVSKLSICNLNGEISDQRWLQYGKNEIQLGLLPRGAYILIISNSSGDMHRKIIRE